MKKTFVNAILLIPFSLCSACIPDLSPSYGRVKLKVSESQEIFFKREASGLNYDVLVISPSDDLCEIPNPKTDYVFRSTGVTVYYKVENDSLILFTNQTATPPEGGQFPIKIEQKGLNTLEAEEIKKKAEELGLRSLDVPFDDRLKCSR